MAISDALSQAKGTTGRQLKVDILLDQFDKRDAADFRAALEDPDVSARLLERAMTINGSPVSEGAITKWRHRNGAR